MTVAASAASATDPEQTKDGKPFDSADHRDNLPPYGGL
jgi:hypothetical protein